VGGLAGETAQQSFGGGGAGPDRGRVLDHQIVVVLDDLGTDRTGQRWAEQRVGEAVGVAGQVQLHRVDLLEAGDQVEVQQPGDAETNETGSMRIHKVGLQLHVGAVPHGALDHRVDLGGRAGQQLTRDGHRADGVDHPVDQNASFGPFVPRVPLREDVLIEGGKWVESEATAVVPSPHSQVCRAAKVALAMTRATSQAPATDKNLRRA
jgi:hypothetical protein